MFMVIYMSIVAKMFSSLVSMRSEQSTILYHNGDLRFRIKIAMHVFDGWPDVPWRETFPC